MCDCDFYPPSVYREKIVTARKPHKCCECGVTIANGDRYQNIFGVWEGYSETFRTCLSCSEERENLAREARETGDCGPCLGELRQYQIDIARDAR